MYLFGPSSISHNNTNNIIPIIILIILLNDIEKMKEEGGREYYWYTRQGLEDRKSARGLVGDFMVCVVLNSTLKRTVIFRREGRGEEVLWRYPNLN